MRMEQFSQLTTLSMVSTRRQGSRVASFGCFVFDFRVLRFRDLGVFVVEFWVLRFRDLGASCLGLRFRVLRFRNLGNAECSNVFFSNTKHFLVLHSVQLLNANYPRYAELSKEDIFSDMWCVYLIHFKLILSEVFHYNSTIQIEWRVFSHVASIYVNFLEQKKAFA